MSSDMMDMMDMSTDMGAMTRDSTQTIGAAMEMPNPAPFNPLGMDWWNQFIARIQELFMHLEMMLQGIESRVHMNLSNLEGRLDTLPNLTPSQRQAVMNRLDMAQMRVDMRFDQARMNLQMRQTRTIDRLMQEEMAALSMGRIPAMDVDLMRGGGRRRRRMLPPGIARQVAMGRPLPPGIARQLGMARMPRDIGMDLNLMFNR